MAVGLNQNEEVSEVTEEPFLELERRGWEALSSDEGGAYYREHLADNALMAFPFGVMTCDEAIEAIETSQPWSHFEISDPRVVSLTDDSAVLVYSVVAQREEEETFTAIASSTFVRQQGAWRLAFHQQSPT